MTLARTPRILRASLLDIPYNKTSEFPMGRGDKKTAKGKRYIASYGNSRPAHAAKTKAAAKKKSGKK